MPLLPLLLLLLPPPSLILVPVVPASSPLIIPDAAPSVRVIGVVVATVVDAESHGAPRRVLVGRGTAMAGGMKLMTVAATPTAMPPVVVLNAANAAADDVGAAPLVVGCSVGCCSPKRRRVAG